MFFGLKGVPVTTELFPGEWFGDLTLLKKCHLFLSLRKQGHLFFQNQKDPNRIAMESRW